jgi:adenine phosphoribosyltransferase
MTLSNATSSNDGLERVRSLITAIPDFPKPGILFRDLFPVFRDPLALEALIAHLTTHLLSLNVPIHVIVGIEARGFLLGPILALRLGASFVPVRKPGKLPGPVVNVSYEKEYGVDIVEMQQGAIHSGQNVIVIDDLIATGGSAKAGMLISVAESSFSLLLSTCYIHSANSECNPFNLFVPRVAGDLIRRLGGNIIENVFVIELAFLNGRKVLDGPTYSCITY